MKSKLQRRKFLGLAGIGLLGSRSALGQSCSITPAQGSGPFYPITDRGDTDWDLTQIDDNPGQATGEQLLLSGTIRNRNCQPIPNALVEMWQANHWGKYDHPGDTSTRPHDPNFQYWGRMTTDSQGNYKFKTIVPGLYSGRTRHLLSLIHI